VIPILCRIGKIGISSIAAAEQSYGAA